MVQVAEGEEEVKACGAGEEHLEGVPCRRRWRRGAQRALYPPEIMSGAVCRRSWAAFQGGTAEVITRSEQWLVSAVLRAASALLGGRSGMMVPGWRIGAARTLRTRELAQEANDVGDTGLRWVSHGEKTHLQC